MGRTCRKLPPITPGDALPVSGSCTHHRNVPPRLIVSRPGVYPSVGSVSSHVHDPADPTRPSPGPPVSYNSHHTHWNRAHWVQRPQIHVASGIGSVASKTTRNRVFPG